MHRRSWALKLAEELASQARKSWPFGPPSLAASGMTGRGYRCHVPP